MGKKATAIILMAAMICLAVPIGAWRSLVKMKCDIDAVFYHGIGGDGYGIQDDLNIIMDQSYNLATIAKNYYDDSDSNISALLAARQELAEAGAPSAKYKANEKLKEAVAVLYDKIKNAPGVSEINLKLAAQCYTEIQSRNTTIQNNGYNAEVEKFNAKLAGFPTAFFAKIAGINKAELFG